MIDNLFFPFTLFIYFGDVFLKMHLSWTEFKSVRMRQGEHVWPSVELMKSCLLHCNHLSIKVYIPLPLVYSYFNASLLTLFFYFIFITFLNICAISITFLIFLIFLEGKVFCPPRTELTISFRKVPSLYSPPSIHPASQPNVLYSCSSSLSHLKSPI